MEFEYYVMNYNCNSKKVEMYNIFRNIYVNEWTEKAVKKYLRSPSKYKYIKEYKNIILGTEEIALYGFEALCEEISSILKNQMWSRREYEINVSDAFTTEVSDIVKVLDNYSSIEELKEDLINIEKRNPKLEKWDCFEQCRFNIPIITRDIIWQYKQQTKEK